MSKRLTLLEGYGLKDTLRKAKKIADSLDEPLTERDYELGDILTNSTQEVSRRDVGGGSEVGRGWVGGTSDIGPTKVGRSSDRPPTSDQPPTHPPTYLQPEYNSLDKVNDPVWYITDRQAIILGYLITKEDKLAQRKIIETSTGVKESYVKEVFNKVLVKEQFITKPKRWNNKGSVYSLHYEICCRFIQERWPIILKNYGDPPFLPPTSDRPPTRPPTDLRPVFFHSSSSVVHNKTTTKKIESILNTEPELAYWREKGLTEKSILHWLEKTGCNFEVIISSLKYCRFELVDMGIEESKPVRDVFNWFFRRIQKLGFYAKPSGYKSHEEKQLEIERSIVAERENQANELKELHGRKKKAEQDTKFWAMMNDPEGEAYKANFAKLNAFQQKLKSGKAFEAAMQVAFEETEEKESLS